MIAGKQITALVIKRSEYTRNGSVCITDDKNNICV